uniref:EF-hand domain-containing protein n=1 Tax=Noctiluca scintillans TaxID=2966 RepID=A0A7S0ZVN0_NOCSC
MDQNGTGFIGRVDFEERLQRPEVQSLLSYFNFDVTDATAFFKLLDVDESGYVDIEEFTVGCLRMHGKSNAIDMEISIQETKRLVLFIAEALREDSNQLKNGIESVAETSRRQKNTLLGKMQMMEGSLLSIEENLGIRDAKGCGPVR